MKKNLITNLAIGMLATLPSYTISCIENCDIFDLEDNLLYTSSYKDNEVSEAKMLTLSISDLEQFPMEVKEERKAAIIISEYIILSDNQYELVISESKANKLGVQSEIYRKFVENINNTNQLILDNIRNGNIVLLADIQKHATDYNALASLHEFEEDQNKVIANNTTKIVFTGGEITTSTAEREGIAYFEPERKHRSVIFSCRANTAPLASYICKVEAFGNTRQCIATGSCFAITKLAVGITGTGSGIVAKVSFSTTDPRGGGCSWKASEGPGN